MADPGSATLEKLHHRSRLQLCPLQIDTSLFRKRQKTEDEQSSRARVRV
jgi:hypothetical protein